MKAYNLKDGNISKIDDVPLVQVHDAYNLVMVKPAEVYDLKTFNRKLLKPEYLVLFDFMHKTFLAYAGTHESATLPKV